MINTNSLDKIKKLREITGVGFNDCKLALDNCNGDIEKSIEFLRKKGITKANKRMERTAGEGLVAISKNEKKISIIEINCETDFVAKNNEFISFTESISNISLENNGVLEKILETKMENKKKVKDNLIDLISKIGEKITIRRSHCLKNDNSFYFSYIHNAVKKNIGKLGVVLSIESSNPKNVKFKEFGHHLSMHIASFQPLSIDANDLDKNLITKEEEIIKEELLTSGKDPVIVDKISKGKLKKFIEENTLLHQNWIMDPKKKVKDIMKELSDSDIINVKSYVRYKVGEGV